MPYARLRQKALTFRDLQPIDTGAAIHGKDPDFQTSFQ
jgi:hypothetical protein